MHAMTGDLSRPNAKVGHKTTFRGGVIAVIAARRLSRHDSRVYGQAVRLSHMCRVSYHWHCYIFWLIR
jgi:hypothetical protein